jgi:hypothetical protein
MNDNTPNSLEPVKKADVAKMSKWPLYAFIAVVLLLAALVYSVNFAHNQEEDHGGTPKVVIREEKNRCSWAKAGASPWLRRPTPRLSCSRTRSLLLLRKPSRCLWCGTSGKSRTSIKGNWRTSGA